MTQSDEPSYIQTFKCPTDSPSHSVLGQLFRTDSGYTLTITGTGPIRAPKSILSHPWGRHTSRIHRIQIGEGITEIESGAFSDLPNLESVSLPNSLTAIYSEAFSYCQSLTSLHLPNALFYIGPRTFYGCTILQSISFGREVQSIESEAFAGCISLEKLILPASLRKLGDHAFAGCQSLSELSLPDGLSSIYAGTFCRCPQLKRVKIPSDISYIAEQSFARCTNLETLDLRPAQNLKTLHATAFSGCSKLLEVLLTPEQETRFGYLFPKRKSGAAQQRIHTVQTPSKAPGHPIS